jgi:transposase
MGVTNTSSFYWFILRLVEQLESENRSWREQTVLLLDNASYHRASMLREKFQLIQLPILFLGPYQFQLAPIERFFAYIKARDLNPSKRATSSL